MKEPQIKISQQLLERYLLNEIFPEEKTLIETALKQDLQLQQKLKDLQKANMDFHDNYPLEREINIIEQKAKWGKKQEAGNPPLSFGTLFYKPAYKFGFAFSLMLVVALSSFWMRQQQLKPEIILKGLTPKLEIYLKTAAGPVLLNNRDSLREGQTIQVKYQAAGQKYGVIFSVDGRQNVTLHFPEKNLSVTKLNPQGKISLDYSYQLDDAPLYEKFFFITSQSPLNSDEILEIYGEKWSQNPDSEDTKKLDSEKQMYSITFFKK